MANALYPLWKQGMMLGNSNEDLDQGNLELLLVDNTYSYSPAHGFRSDVSTGVIADTDASQGGPLQSVTVDTSGVVDAADHLILNVNNVGGDVVGLIMYRNTGVTTTSRLIMFMDTGVTGFPLTPNGSDVNVIWNASGIFQL